MNCFNGKTVLAGLAVILLALITSSAPSHVYAKKLFHKCSHLKQQYYQYRHAYRQARVNFVKYPSRENANRSLYYKKMAKYYRDRYRLECKGPHEQRNETRVRQVSAEVRNRCRDIVEKQKEYFNRAMQYFGKDQVTYLYWLGKSAEQRKKYIRECRHGVRR